MSVDRLQRAAQYLADLRQPGPRPVRIPAQFAPRDEAEAYELQQRVGSLLQASPAAWKVAMNAADAGSFAPVFASDLHASGVSFVSPITGQLGIEPEVAFSLKQALPPGRQYTRQDVIDAIGSAYPAIEVVISRFARYESAPPLDRLADNLSNGGLILGAPLERWQQLDLATLPLTLVITPAGQAPQVHRSRGGHPQADPLLPMTWIVNALAARGIGLRPGEVVTTGSYAGLHHIAVGTQVRVQFEGLGEVELH